MHLEENDLLTAALVGYEIKHREITERIAELRRQLGSARPSTAAAAPKHHISAAGRARIAAAQRARWTAAGKAKQTEPPEAGSRTRVLSAEGRARIVAALKKRWAAAKKPKTAPLAPGVSAKRAAGQATKTKAATKASAKGQPADRSRPDRALAARPRARADDTSKASAPTEPAPA